MMFSAYGSELTALNCPSRNDVALVTARFRLAECGTCIHINSTQSLLNSFVVVVMSHSGSEGTNAPETRSSNKSV